METIPSTPRCRISAPNTSSTRSKRPSSRRNRMRRNARRRSFRNFSKAKRRNFGEESTIMIPHILGSEPVQKALCEDSSAAGIVD